MSFSANLSGDCDENIPIAVLLFCSSAVKRVVNYYVTVLLVLTNNSSSTRLILCGESLMRCDVNPITIIFVSLSQFYKLIRSKNH